LGFDSSGYFAVTGETNVYTKSQSVFYLGGKTGEPTVCWDRVITSSGQSKSPTFSTRDTASFHSVPVAATGVVSISSPRKSKVQLVCEAEKASADETGLQSADYAHAALTASRVSEISREGPLHNKFVPGRPVRRVPPVATSGGPHPATRA
jgi:hypothetical protein